jgi:hypothetical protein
MFNNVGHNAYWILMAINLLGLAVVVLFWPETKGISLEHMDKLFGEVDKVDAFKVENRVATVEDIFEKRRDDQQIEHSEQVNNDEKEMVRHEEHPSV